MTVNPSHHMVNLTDGRAVDVIVDTDASIEFHVFDPASVDYGISEAHLTPDKNGVVHIKVIPMSF